MYLILAGLLAVLSTITAIVEGVILYKRFLNRKQIKHRVLMCIRCNNRHVPSRDLYYESNNLFDASDGMNPGEKGAFRVRLTIRGDKVDIYYDSSDDPPEPCVDALPDKDEKLESTNSENVTKLRVATNIVLMNVSHFMQRLIQYYSIIKRSVENVNYKR